MAEFPDHLRIRESEESLLVFARKQTLDEVACPACGSAFVMHICHAEPRRPTPVVDLGRFKIRGLHADRVILDEVEHFPGPHDELLGF